MAKIDKALAAGPDLSDEQEKASPGGRKRRQTRPRRSPDGGEIIPRHHREQQVVLPPAVDAHLSLHFMYYNFVRIHQTTRVTPAMAAGVTDTLWEIEDIARLAD